MQVYFSSNIKAASLGAKNYKHNKKLQMMRHKTTCRICGNHNLVKVLDMGKMPLSNAFLKENELNKPEKKFSLIVYFCRGCGLLQILDVVRPELLFSNYYYLTS